MLMKKNYIHWDEGQRYWLEYEEEGEDNSVLVLQLYKHTTTAMIIKHTNI